MLVEWIIPCGLRQTGREQAGNLSGGGGGLHATATLPTPQPPAKLSAPEASGKIQGAFLLGIALAEATAIYGLVVALLLIFQK